MENKIYTFEEGSMWERYPWKISINAECSEYGGGKPCRHSTNIHIKKTKIFGGIDDEYRIEKVWNCDVVIASNEGEYNSTGVCLWCIIEAVKDELGLER